MAVGGSAARTRTLAQRYAPFLAIVALQLVLLTVTPRHRTEMVQQSANPNAGTASVTPQGGGVSGSGAPGTGTEATSGGQGTVSGASGVSGGAPGAGPAVTGARAAGSPAPATGGSGTQARSAAAAASAAQPVDALGRPTGGDKSKCATGALVQTDVISHQIPCTPKFEGDNGGASASQGVTKDTITVVMVHPHYPQGIQQALEAGGLEATDQQYQEFLGIEAAFFNKHYEFYGRQIKAIYWAQDCTDPACWRADAKAMVAKYHPFAAFWYTAGIAPEPYMDQLSQLGVVNLGVVPLSDAWLKNHAPYAWDEFPQGDREADMIADYYCKKMVGQLASHAGDPTMRVKTRKLGILSSEDPSALETAQRLKAAVTGGQCGSANDGVTLYTFSADAATAQNEAPTLVTRMKNDGITTRIEVGAIPGSPEDDKQQYFPENVMDFASDADIVGRLFEGLISPNQMRDTFGLGWLEAAQPLAQQDWSKAIKEMNPSYDAPRIAQGAFNDLMILADQIQWAGPHLTPKTIEAGAHSSPQVGGWTNPNPWPGWKCCNPHVNELKLGVNANSYTAKVDAKEEYWDPHAISNEDNQPGAFVCVDPNCRRYEIGQWAKGEAMKP